jgi:hypothetical protein
MIELTSPEVVRPVNIGILLAIVAVLSYRHTQRGRARLLDDRIASFTCMLVFSMMAFATGVNYTKGVQMGPIVPYFTLTLLLFLVALMTPWRWRLRRRK